MLQPSARGKGAATELFCHAPAAPKPTAGPSLINDARSADTFPGRRAQHGPSPLFRVRVAPLQLSRAARSFSTKMPPRPILCFGQILWDFLPEGIFLGGAPANVAYHLARQGQDARLVSAVGRDALGDEILRRLGSWRLDTRLIARLGDAATGSAVATVSPSGDASYVITAEVAWDRIPAEPRALEIAANAAALVFGSLAQRSAFNQASLQRFLDALPADALRVFDVNLRAPHDDLAVVRRLASRTNLLKLNAEEAVRLSEVNDADDLSPEVIERAARALHTRHACPLIVVTGGALGAGLLRAGESWTWEPARPIIVADTVGAGDGFLACFLANLLAGPVSDATLLARACRHGEWIASNRGATPSYASLKPEPVAAAEA